MCIHYFGGFHVYVIYSIKNTINFSSLWCSFFRFVGSLFVFCILHWVPLFLFLFFFLDSYLFYLFSTVFFLLFATFFLTHYIIVRVFGKGESRYGGQRKQRIEL